MLKSSTRETSPFTLCAGHADTHDFWVTGSQLQSIHKSTCHALFGKHLRGSSFGMSVKLANYLSVSLRPKHCVFLRRKKPFETLPLPKHNKVNRGGRVFTAGNLRMWPCLSLCWGHSVSPHPRVSLSQGHLQVGSLPSVPPPPSWVFICTGWSSWSLFL